jgi:hypothetical protein
MGQKIELICWFSFLDRVLDSCAPSEKAASPTGDSDAKFSAARAGNASMAGGVAL